VLISNLLDLSRLEGGALRLDRDWYDFSELLETVCGRLQPMLVNHPLELDVDACAGDAYVDYVLIGQVVQNLAENAAKFSPAGRAIHVAGRANGADLELRVEDEGEGVPAGDRERVFEKFYRGQQGGRSSGVGLGLTISKGIVEAHGGRIRAEKSEYGGAAFIVTIPAVSFRRRPPAMAEGAVV
jgi:two-component system sensor histidine kinase KdpD